MSISSPASEIAKTIFFPEGPGFVFQSVLAVTGISKVVIVRSLGDGQLYVRKQSDPDAITRQLGVQSTEIRNFRSLGHLNGIANLSGWVEYHDEQDSNNFVTVTYGKLYNAGTLDDICNRLQREGRSLPEECLWSMYIQMLGIMINTIRAGVLHTDSHWGNWFVDTNNGSIPQVVLGDWGIAEEKPNQHLQLCSQQSCCNSCPVQLWWDTCWDHLKTFVVGPLHGLLPTVLHSSEYSTLPEEAPGAYLSLLLDKIRNNPPSKFPTGEEWFAMIERLHAWLIQAQTENNVNHQAQRTDRINHNHDHLQIKRSTEPPPFDEALPQVQTLDRLSGHDSSARFWRIAHIDPITREVVALEGRHGRNGYENHMDQSTSPVEWARQHTETTQLVKSLESEIEQTEEQDKSDGKYDTGFEAFF